MSTLCGTNSGKRALRTVAVVEQFFRWGLETVMTRRYLEDDTGRARSVRRGVSLDMVGEDTRKTGDTFLIEKRPNPSATCTRGDDHHTAWGGQLLTLAQLTSHYFNDCILDVCQRQVARTGWVICTHPYEGGSDHTAPVRAGKAGLLFWHFTDHYRHADGDRLDKVSASRRHRSSARGRIGTAMPCGPRMTSPGPAIRAASMAIEDAGARNIAQLQ